MVQTILNKLPQVKCDQVVITSILNRISENFDWNLMIMKGLMDEKREKLTQKLAGNENEEFVKKIVMQKPSPRLATTAKTPWATVSTAATRSAHAAHVARTWRPPILTLHAPYGDRCAGQTPATVAMARVAYAK